MTKQWARLTDSQWAKVSQYLNTTRKRKHDLRNIFDAILWFVRTGSQWRNLDSQFPSYKIVFLTDTLGCIGRVEVHSANTHDGIAGKDLVYPNFTDQMERAEKILGDHAYRGQFKDLIKQVGQSVVFECPSRIEGTKGFVAETKRWVVERTFAWFNFYPDKTV